MEGATSRFVLINVDEHEALPGGCCMRFKLASEPRAVRLVRYEPEDAEASAEYVVESPAVESPTARAGVGASGGAWAAEVEDSSAGTSTLVYGGPLGLRLFPVGGGAPIAEPYLLLAQGAVLE